MIYLQLFFSFLKVGAFAFGGGYAMLSLIGDSVLSYGWMNETELLNFVGVETVIPGPIAVNMATYVGYEQGGFLGALLATIGVVLPSFIIILIVAAFIKNLLKFPAVKTFIMSIRPALGGLIASVVGMLIYGLIMQLAMDYRVNYALVILYGVAGAIPGIVWNVAQAVASIIVFDWYWSLLVVTVNLYSSFV